MKYIRPPKPDFTTILLTNKYKCIMKKNLYDVTRLATLYFPDSTERNARRRLFKVLRAERDLWATPHGTALRCLATELYTPPIRNGHRHPRQTGGDGRRLPRVAARIGRPSIGRKHLGKTGEKCTFSSGKPTENVHERANNAHPCFRRYLPLHCHPDDKRVTKIKKTNF